MASAGSQRLSRDEYKKQRELDELRKSGAVPAAVDEDGRMINPHIPKYISEAPWYLNASQHPSLKHQRADAPAPPSDIHRYQRRGLLASATTTTRFRAGACDNCGAMTHVARDCTERPRRRQARHTGRDIRPDEVCDQVDLSFDGKRDRWNGYDPATYTDVIEHFQRTDRARQHRNAAALASASASSADRHASSPGNGSSSSSTSDDDDDADAGVVVQKRDARTRTTVRNLRIREDRAKYLINLDVDSAYYDSKSRSMRDNPYAGTGVGADQVAYAGDNFVRASGDVHDFVRLQSYAWEAAADAPNAPAAAALPPAAAPSQAEFLYKQHLQEAGKARAAARSAILDKYGGGGDADGAVRLDPTLVLGQSEAYTEYAPDGSVLRGAAPAARRSKYVEDVVERGHAAVFGSHFDPASNRWGYRCCRQTLRNAYCTGTPAPAPAPVAGARPAPPAAKRALAATQQQEDDDDDDDAYLRDRRRDGDPVSSTTKKVKR
ncbi:Pre-mRNA-splicing factor SLU7 [Plasmodiophora brassicae]